jgi:hypothetical protein
MIMLIGKRTHCRRLRRRTAERALLVARVTGARRMASGSRNRGGGGHAKGGQGYTGARRAHRVPGGDCPNGTGPDCAGSGSGSDPPNPPPATATASGLRTPAPTAATRTGYEECVGLRVPRTLRKATDGQTTLRRPTPTCIGSGLAIYVYLMVAALHAPEEFGRRASDAGWYR